MRPCISSRPPFEPGNTVSLHHGANSPRSLEPIAAELEEQIIQTAPWLAIVPGVAIVLAVLSLNVFGDGLRDALDPRAKIRVEH